MRGTMIALVFVLALNAFFFWGQTAVTSINPSAPQFFNYANSHIARYDQGNYTLPNNPNNELPSLSSSVSPTTGNIFTDGISYVQNWLYENTGIGYVIAIVNTVPNFLKAIGFPAAFAYAIGYIWYAFSVVILILFVRGILE